MKLSNILKGVDYELIQGSVNRDINYLNYNSRLIQENDIFICVKGFKTDGHKYVESALKNGAKVIICEDIVNVSEDITVIKVENSRRVLAICAKNYYCNPCDSMKVIGITGTNGKSTSVFMLKTILEEAGFKVGLIGTVANYIGSRKIKTERTTPESLELQKLFREMVDEKVEYCLMEVSSHSLALDRVYGIEFSSSIFTNLTQDHLDFHKTLENYFQAKKMLFSMTENEVINIDDDYGKRIYAEFKNTALTYGINEGCDLRAYNIENESKGVKFNLDINGKTYLMDLVIPGNHNVYNALGVIGVALKENIEVNKIIKGLEKAVVPGRCEIVSVNKGLDYDIVVDYAHTPDGLENILNCSRDFTTGKLITVFGCGGDRDKTKRPIMGKIASDLSESCIVTSDNPRTEEPISIIEDILQGITKDNYLVEENRRNAIKKAMEMAKKGDVIVIAGKGHEDYQVLKNGKIHFDEREIVDEILKELR